MGLRENIFKDTIAELAVRQPILVSPKTSARQVATQLRLRQLGCAFVIDALGKPIGKFTQRQIMKLLVEDSKKLDGPVEDVMYRQCDTIRIDEPISRLIELMSAQQIRYLAVVDSNGSVIGLTGQKGLMEYIADHFPRQVKVQRMKPLIALETKEGA